MFIAFFLVQRLQQFKGVFTLFGIKDGFGSLAIFTASIDAKYPDDLSSSLGKRVGEVTEGQIRALPNYPEGENRFDKKK